MRVLYLCFAFSLMGLTSQLRADGFLKGSEARTDFIQSAKVWTSPESPIGALDLSQSPAQCPAFEADQVVSCTYKKPKRGDDTGGLTPKFKCKTADGKSLKVKYGQDNAETFTEVFSSRLLLALGFYADCNYPVAKVICKDCPANPDRYTRDYANGKEDPAEAMATREFPFAMIEEKFGEEIVAELDGKVVEGWGFNEVLRPELQSIDFPINVSIAASHWQRTEAAHRKIALWSFRTSERPWVVTRSKPNRTPCSICLQPLRSASGTSLRFGTFGEDQD